MGSVKGQNLFLMEVQALFRPKVPEKCNLLHSNQMVLLVCNHPKCLPLCHLPNKYHLSNPLKHPPFHQPKNHPFLHHNHLHSNHLAYKLLVLLKLSQMGGIENLKLEGGEN